MHLELVVFWDGITQLFVYIFSSYLGQSCRNNESWAAVFGTRVPNGCFACGTGCHRLWHEQKCEVNSNFQHHCSQRSTNI